MNPAAFDAERSDARLRRRQGSQEHLIDLYALRGEPTLGEDEPCGDGTSPHPVPLPQAGEGEERAVSNPFSRNAREQEEHSVSDSLSRLRERERVRVSGVRALWFDAERPKADDEILKRLFALNPQRAAAGR